MLTICNLSQQWLFHTPCIEECMFVMDTACDKDLFIMNLIITNPLPPIFSSKKDEVELICWHLRSLITGTESDMNLEYSAGLQISVNEPFVRCSSSLKLNNMDVQSDVFMICWYVLRPLKITKKYIVLWQGTRLNLIHNQSDTKGTGVEISTEYLLIQYPSKWPSLLSYFRPYFVKLVD